MATTNSLGDAAQDRKARLAQLKSLKRKNPPQADSEQTENTDSTDLIAPSITSIHLSGRNYDPETRGPKLGFEVNPAENQTTLEEQAAVLAEQTRAEAEAEERAGEPLDLFKLQPKKPNWDLKRDLDKKLEILNVRTDNAIARLVRQRIEATQKAKAAQSSSAEGEDVGMDGTTLLGAMHEREREEEEEARREREEEAAETT